MSNILVICINNPLSTHFLHWCVKPVKEIRFQIHWQIKDNSATAGPQRNSRNGGRTPSDRQGPNKFNLLCNGNILEHPVCHVTCNYAYKFLQVTLMLTPMLVWTSRCCQKSVWLPPQIVCSSLRFTFCNFLLVTNLLLSYLVNSIVFTIYRYFTVNCRSTTPIQSRSIQGCDLVKAVVPNV